MTYRVARRLLGPISFLFLLLYMDSSFAQSRPTAAFPFRMKVSLDVSCSNNGLATVVEGYLSQQLRRMEGVVLVDEDEDLELNVVVMEWKTQSGISTGYVISSAGILITRPAILALVAQTMGCTSATEKEFSEFSGIGSLRHHAVHSSGISDLREACERTVAGLNTTILEPERRRWDKFNEAMRRVKSASP